MKSPDIGGGQQRPHNLDLKSLRVSPEQKPVGWGVKKPVEHQRTALPKGVSAPVAKQPEGTNPIVTHVNELQRQATLRREEAVPLQLNPAEQKDRERLSKPPPAESPVQEQAEPTSKKPTEPAENPASPYQEFAAHLKRNRRSAVIGGRGWGHEWFERLKDIDKG